MTELLPTPDSTIVAKSLTSTVIKVKPSKPIPSEPVQWTPTAAVSSSSVSVHSTKPFSFSNKRSSTIKLGKSTTLAKSGFGKSPAPPTQSSSEPTSAFSTPIIPSGPGIPFPLPQNSTYMTKQQSSASVGYTSEATPSKSRFSFPKRPTSKTTLRKSASSTSVGPSTSASPIIQSSSRYTNTSSTLIRQEGTKFSFPGRPTPITTKLTSKRPSKDASYGSDRPETATETAPYSVVPSVIKCRCKGNPNVDPPCCKAVYKTVTKTEPTTKPIVILVPDPTTIYGEKLTVTKDLWKTLTDRKTFTKEKWGTCKTTVLDYKTQTLCKAPEPTYNAPPHDIGRPDEPYHDGPGRWDEPSDVSVADDCSPGYSCLPDPGYCRTKCNDYFDGCMEGQCRADFFRCYDDCLWEENRGRIDHPGYGEIGRPGDLFNSTEKCHNGCRSKDWGCHEDCDKKYVGHALGAVDSMDHYAHEQGNIKISAFYLRLGLLLPAEW
ncbi:hypothetical protein N0V93_000675 [Gnomoniopsis smithogilvyi]|uniref:Uncharacterized protein n=1 Tax=Gnomoniopsis smithogilvyi TaxID=1191159 RepID=A0A9W9D1Z4_9PEZI|nr:hypothetical protein N0V93_000675 [Gnomoniopsis smithogilvyi]